MDRREQETAFGEDMTERLTFSLQLYPKTRRYRCKKCNWLLATNPDWKRAYPPDNHDERCPKALWVYDGSIPAPDLKPGLVSPYKVLEDLSGYRHG